MWSRQARRPDLFEKRVELPVHAALSVHDDEPFVVGAQPVQLLAELVQDAGRIEVQERRHAIDVDVPSAPVDYLFDLAAEGPADQQRRGAHLTCSPCADSPDYRGFS